MKYPQDGNVGAHCGILLPLSKYCSSILEAPSFAGPIQVVKTRNDLLFFHTNPPLPTFLNSEQHSLSFQQKVVLAGSSMNAVAAVKNLVYTGTCFLDKVP